MEVPIPPTLIRFTQILA